MQAVVTHTRFLHRPGSNPLSVVSSALYGWFKPSHTRLGFFLSAYIIARCPPNAPLRPSRPAMPP